MKSSIKCLVGPELFNQILYKFMEEDEEDKEVGEDEDVDVFKFMYLNFHVFKFHVFKFHVVSTYIKKFSFP